MTRSSTFNTRLLTGLAVAGTAAAAVFLMRRLRGGAVQTTADRDAYRDPIDEEAAGSFPASDPPSHAATLGATPTT